MPNELSITVGTHDAGAAVVVLVGEVDMATAPELDVALSGIEGNVVVDLDSVTFFDSSGIKVLLHAHERLHQAGFTLRIRGESTFVEQVLNITGVGELLRGNDDPSDPDMPLEAFGAR